LLQYRHRVPAGRDHLHVASAREGEVGAVRLASRLLRLMVRSRAKPGVSNHGAATHVGPGRLAHSITLRLKARMSPLGPSLCENSKALSGHPFGPRGPTALRQKRTCARPATAAIRLARPPN
jgi:hypothetical protein